MGKGAHKRVMTASIAAVAASVIGLSGCAGGGSGGAEDGTVTLEFTQWWEPELPDGALRSLMDEFEQQNPGIKVELLSGPYSSTREQIVAGSASGTLSDVVGLDGGWVYDLVQQGAIADLSEAMQTAGYDDSQLASQVQVDGATYSIPAVNFSYMLFTNDKLLSEAGVDEPPSTRSEFLSAAEAVTEKGDASGWALPLSLESPVGVQNDVMSWNWASGGRMLANGQPDLTNPDVTATVDYIKQLNDAGVIAPGAANLKEQDKVEEFTNERVGMMISSLAHINLLRENNPDLEFSVSPVPVADGFSGTPGVTFASWGVGVSSQTEHPEEAWKLIEFLMSPEANASLATSANGFPGNVNSEPGFDESDELYKAAYEAWQAGEPVNEFNGLPVAEQLMRIFDEELQRSLDQGQPVPDTLAAINEQWTTELSQS
ncbi:ABC transporter substrate-binding protein [Naumannella halotolerans]|uniref:Multiple sugar transport system substrate-binding protein n=1 Tax=Naumannella halotolerans TaxID=993414 RepID=A0A4R7JBR6_9ACTN|nr:sugar ABC transporter substrate-binding protein [Naumannella halotolerans]TDT33889.1 multiple sugar transport system substrate-binding protein [Naumannella halotolerans]